VADDEQRFQELCELTSKEQDPEKLIQLAAELSRILEARELKLQEQRRVQSPHGQDAES
jgi:hypothetical protein